MYLDSSSFENKNKMFVASLDADQVERSALRLGQSSIEVGTEDERIAGVIDDGILAEGNGWEERQRLLEDQNASIAEELDRRAHIMGDNYPFILEGSSLTYRPSQSGVYEVCLAVSRNSNYRVDDFPVASALFEWICRDAIKVFFGETSLGLRTGWPRYERFGETTSLIKETIAIINQETSEFCWHPEDGYPNNPSTRYLKDMGLDVVVWKPWSGSDRRSAHFFALAQCGCGKGDVSINKAQDLRVKRLRKWMHPVTHVTPQKCFCVSHHVPNTFLLKDLSEEGGLVFDRARLACLAESNPDVMSPYGDIDYHQLAALYVTGQAE